MPKAPLFHLSCPFFSIKPTTSELFNPDFCDVVFESCRLWRSSFLLQKRQPERSHIHQETGDQGTAIHHLINARLARPTLDQCRTAAAHPYPCRRKTCPSHLTRQNLLEWSQSVEMEWHILSLPSVQVATRSAPKTRFVGIRTDND